jgi:hypothetical protein
MFNPFDRADDDTEVKVKVEIDDSFNVTNPTAKAIKMEITTLGEKKWSKKGYANIDSKIRVSLPNKLIDNSENESLTNFLNLSYINTLNAATVNFFSSSRNAGELSSIYSELKRYSRTEYKEYITTMKNACSDFYSLKRLQSRIAGFDYFSDGEENQVTTNFRNLDNFGSKSFLSKSPLVKKIISSSKSQLKSKMSNALISDLRPKIEDYIRNKEQTDGQTDTYKRTLNDLEQNQYLRNNNNIASFVRKANDDLASHTQVALRMINLEFNPKTCEDICTRHLYYIEVCKGKRQAIVEQDTTISNPDTTGTGF